MWNPRDRLLNRETMQEIGAGYRRSGVTLHLPLEGECNQEGCGHDTLSDSKKRIDCPACNERGYIVTWNVQTIYCRVRWIDPLRYTVQIAAGVEMADLLLHIRETDYGAVQNILHEQDAYIMVDGYRVRPTAMQPEGVGGIDGWQCRCNKVS